MKNIFLSVVVVATLIAGGLGGTMAGFVDTEVSEDNYYYAGHMDLLINGANDPDVPTKISETHGVPCKSIDAFIEAENRGDCADADLYMHIKNLVMAEAGTKDGYVWDVDYGYIMDTPVGPWTATSEPEYGAEHGDFLIGNLFIDSTDPAETGIMGQDCDLSGYLDLLIEVCDDDTTDPYLNNPDDNGDGQVSLTEYNNHNWVGIYSGLLADADCIKYELGRLGSQDVTFIHVVLHLPQVTDPLAPRDYDGDGDTDADDAQLAVWPTNAFQGDTADFDILFELVAVDP